jgi:FkbM family methyltransferase
MKHQLKSVLRLMTRQLRVRIAAGSCSGMRWSLTTRARFLRGDYEPDLACFIEATLRPQDIFWDVGAHFGYYTLLASRAVSLGHCFAFEPSARNLWYLRHHLQWNGITNAIVQPVAVAAADGERPFGSAGTGSGRLEGGAQRVAARSVDSLILSGDCKAPTFLKIDVEGAEAEVLEGAGHLLEGRTATLCIATHSPALYERCIGTLRRHGYAPHTYRKPGLIIAAGAGRDIPASTIALITRQA